MPIYEYRCSSCGHELETLQKFSDPPLVACPSCKAAALVKLMSAAGFQLKGSGWYATDFKSSGAKPAPAKGDGESKSESSSEKKDEAKGENKSETKTEGKSEGKTESKSESKSENKTETKSESTSGAKAPPSGTGPPPATT
jgi:putative FmdB family regulatory protein